MNSIRHFHETRVDLFVLIPGSASPADAGTKLNSSLTEFLALTLENCIAYFELGKIGSASRHEEDDTSHQNRRISRLSSLFGSFRRQIGELSTSCCLFDIHLSRMFSIQDRG